MAVTSGDTLRCCANLQHTLDEMHAAAPDATRQKLGLLEGLKSPQNSEKLYDVKFRDGKGRPQSGNACTAEVQFEMPDCVTAADAAIDICGDLTDYGDNRGYLDVTVDQVTARAGEFTLDEFLCICESPSEREAKLIRHLARSIRSRMENRAATLLAGYISNYANGVDSSDVAGAGTRQLNILNTAGHVNAAEFVKILSEYRRQFASTNPIVVGGNILADYEDIRIQGLGANAVGATANGVVIPGMKQFVSFDMDAALETAIGTAAPAGTSFAVTWHPGAVHLLEYYDNVGEREWFKEDSVRTVITVDGMDFDFRLKWEECDEPHWKIVLEKRWDLFAIPDTIYAPCFNSNGILLWTLGCGEPECINVEEAAPA